MKGVKLVGKVLLWIILVVVVLFLIVLVVVKVKSPGELAPITNINNQEFLAGINEKVYCDINGVTQGMFLRGEDKDKPVLLFLHGGPGSPELAMGMGQEEKNARLEQEFVVCYWDQRGAGMSYNSNINVSTMTLEQMIEDTKAVTLYLKEHFGQDKIYILGHSWGSYLGVKTIEKYPEYYHAFIGLGQVTNQTESEKLAYKYMLKEANRRDDKDAIKELEKVDVNVADFPSTKYIQGTRSNLMNKYGIGVMHKDFWMLSIIIDIFTFEGYKMGEKLGYMQGMLFSQDNLFHYVTNDNLLETSKDFEIPVYIFQGDYDYQVSQVLAKDWYDVIEAPDKQFYAFAESAHSPLWEEPEKFMEGIREVLERTK